MKKLASLLAVGWSGLCSAGLFPVPTDISVGVEMQGLVGFNKYTVSSVRLVEDSDADLVLIWGGQVGLAAYNRFMGWTFAGELVKADGQKTYGELAMLAWSRGVNTVSGVNSAFPPECIAFIRTPTNYPINYSHCGNVGQSFESCDVSQKDIELNHGIISRTGTFTTTSPIEFTCTSGMNVKLIITNPKLQLGAGLTSALSIDGVRDGQQLYLKRGMNTMVIRSELTNTAAVVGQYSASTILYVVYP